ncbi:phosphotransferase [Nocardioides sp. MAH-18]|uniref:Phosphotransferase n=1 Tax=Nocardioides agri TaxID=2682843 RepID=A0A6L6XU28_9ACTN|nr:phosphotransferase [Nocardioides sp. CGMCC 1.13656]MVQ50689.1 phosphotransferase [Nocardioides sp. MAH-18]
MDVVNVDGLTAGWLAGVLGREVGELRVERVGTGQIGACYRLRFGDETLLAKLPPADPGERDMMAGAYRGEVRFYQQVAGTVAVRTPYCHHAEIAEDSGDFVLLLEDLAPAEQGDQIAGCTVEEARAAAVNLAGLHGPRWCDPTLAEVDTLSLNGPEEIALLLEMYGPTTELFLDGLGDLVAPQDAATLRACVPVIGPWLLARQERFGLVHGDYRLDNLMFSPDSTDVAAVDWQTLSLALPARDLAYLVATSLAPDDRRAHERDIVAAYHHALVGYGVADYPFDLCWEDYVFAMLQVPLVATFGCAYSTSRSERGDRMFAAMVARGCAAIRDLGSLDVVGQ